MDELSKLKELLKTIDIVPTSFFNKGTKVLLISYQEYDEIKHLLAEYSKESPKN